MTHIGQKRRFQPIALLRLQPGYLEFFLLTHFSGNILDHQQTATLYRSDGLTFDTVGCGTIIYRDHLWVGTLLEQ